MKRDMDLVRLVLLEVEKAEARVIRVNVEGYSNAQTQYHVKILLRRRLPGVTLVKSPECTLSPLIQPSVCVLTRNFVWRETQQRNRILC